MKVLLELLGDVGRVLNGVEGLSDFRPESRERVRELLTQLKFESERILESSGDVGEAKAGREAFLQRSLEAISTQEYEVARGILEDAVSAFPEDFEFLNYLGLIAWEQEDLRGAELAYHRAVQIVFGDDLDVECVSGEDDPVLRAVEGRALSLYRLGEFEKALIYFRWLGTNFPGQYIGCRYLAGEIHQLRGETEKAIECYEGVPVEPAVLYNLGLAHFENDALEEAAYTLLRAFVANVHIVSYLLDSYTYRKPCTPGYLGSETYAEEFANACMRLWHRASGSLHFLEGCFEHSLVKTHLQHCSEKGGTQLLQVGDGTMECDGWLDQLQDEPTLRHIAQRVLERLRS